MGTNHRGINHDVAILAVFQQIRKNLVPDPRSSPSGEAFVGRFVLAVAFRHILPAHAGTQNPQHPIHKPLSFTDPTGLDCAYLNDAGTGLEKGSLDQSSSSGECGRTGGYWVDGGLTNLSVNAGQGSVQLTGTTN